MAQYLTEEAVKQKLGIRDFRNLTKEKAIQLTSMLSEMDSETAVKVIEQFPAFASFATSMVAHLKETCTAILSENKHSSQQVFDAYRTVLDNFAERLKTPELPEEEKHFIAEKMIEIADKIASKDSENKNFLTRTLNTMAAFAGGVVMIAGAILGVKFLKKD